MPTVAVVAFTIAGTMAVLGVVLWARSRRRKPPTPRQDPVVDLVDDAVEAAADIVNEGEDRQAAIPKEKADEIRNMDGDAFIELVRDRIRGRGHGGPGRDDGAGLPD